MNLDERGRRAAGEIRRAVGEPGAVRDADADPLERFERARRARRTPPARGERRRGDRHRRRSRWSSSSPAFIPSDEQAPATGPLPPGTILYGEWDQRASLAHWYTIATDGSQRTDLGIDASCAAWFPDGGRILVTNDAGFTAHEPAPPGGDRRPTARTCARSTRSTTPT